MPIGQPYISAPGVIGLQRLAHDREEIKQPTLFQRLADRLHRFSFTEVLVVDVRMGHVSIAGCFLGIHGHDLIWACESDPVPAEHDLKRPQIHPFQNNRLGRDGKPQLFEIHLDDIKLLLNGQQIVKNVALAGHEMAGLRLQLAQGAVQVVPKSLHFIFQRAFELDTGCRPTQTGNPFCELRQPASSVPGGNRKFDLPACSSLDHQPLVDPGRGS